MPANRTLECPICDLALDLPDLEMVTGASGIPVPTEETVAKLKHTEGQMEAHVDSHDPREVIEAFRKADVYIDLLEQEKAALQKKLDAMTERVREIAPPQPGLVRSSVLTDVSAAYQGLDRALTEEAEQVRRQVAMHDPDSTFIPHVPSASRGEGVVGRKT